MPPYPREPASRSLRDARRNRRAWDADSDDYQKEHGRLLMGRRALAWGIWRVPEDDLNVLGPVGRKRVLELGCGAAQWSIALAGKRARPVAMDNSMRQLAHGNAAARAAKARVPLLQGAAEVLPFKDEVFDIVFCDYGAMSFADPYTTVPEVARVLRTDGLLAFSTTTPLLFMCWPDEYEQVTTTLHTPYFGMRRAEWTSDDTVDFQLPYGDWIRLFRANGLQIEDLIEIKPPPRARTSFPGRPLDWARKWPAEVIWKVRKS